MISVVIPTKNEERNIGRLIESINKQGYKDHEVIVVDTGSSDRTIEIAEEMKAKVFQKGPERSAARNYGANKSKGKYLLFLDADMELTQGVLKECADIAKKDSAKALVLPEKTVGKGFISKIRQFEREMYMGDLTIEVARFFDKKAFMDEGGYDLQLTGPEDYDLPYRISKKYKIGRSTKYILHHEENPTLLRLLKKKYYYASQGAAYASKHPELVLVQGNLLFRKAYFRNWRKFVNNPVLGFSFIVIRLLEASAAVFGFISAVGILGFLKTVKKSIFK